MIEKRTKKFKDLKQKNSCFGQEQKYKTKREYKLDEEIQKNGEKLFNDVFIL